MLFFVFQASDAVFDKLYIFGANIVQKSCIYVL